MFFEGQKVRVVDDTAYGRVLKVGPENVLVLTNHGFEVYYSYNEIVPEHGAKDMALSISTTQAREKIMTDKQTKVKNQKVIARGKVPEIDLHIENLLDNWQKMSNYDILQYQMRYFRKRLDKLMEQRCPKIIVIHGKGEGVLRSEIRLELLKHSHIEYLDGSYLEYGVGATELRIHYGGK